MIRTERLKLIPLTPDLKFTFQVAPELFGFMLDVKLPEGWPLFPKAFKPREHDDSRNWGGFAFVLNKSPLLVGHGGYVSKPDAKANVEIGYEIAPEFRDWGYATEAAGVLVERAFINGARSVSVTTLAGANASNAVARKLGMRFVDDDFRADVGPVWRYRVWTNPQSDVVHKREFARMGEIA